MTHSPAPVFAIPSALGDKGSRTRTDADESHLARVALTLDEYLATLQARRAEARTAPGGTGQAALDRDQEVHRLSAQIHRLSRYSNDLCLGRTVDHQGDVTYIGRFGLSDEDGERLLVDWRSPAAEPYFAATPAHPMGLSSRRRYRWANGLVVDYWDEVLDGTTDRGDLSLDEDGAFIASLSASRSSTMRDVLSTIQADQDMIIRADSHGPLVVDGGPGTGKTVVALHRAAYLMYADPRVDERRGGVLFVGPHRPYLHYIADVLPNLGEDGVQTCTLADLVPHGDAAVDEADETVRSLKARREMVDAIGPAVALYEEPPTAGLDVDTPWGEVWIGVDDWAEAFARVGTATPHNESRELLWESLGEVVATKLDLDEDAASDVAGALRRVKEVREAIRAAWPLLEYTDVVADLWEVPAYLRRCAPWLTSEQITHLRRAADAPWTTDDLPLLDAARRRLGDVDWEARRRSDARRRAADAAEMDAVIEHLVSAGGDEFGEGLVSMLTVDDMREKLEDSGHPTSSLDTDRLAGPFAHVIVDEAQELTDAQWQMLIARCPSRSFTIVGDRAQARQRFRGSWEEHLEQVGLTGARRAELTVNYRTPHEVMEAAAPEIRAVLPDANVPRSIRTSGIPVRRVRSAEVADAVATWLEQHREGTVCVIGAEDVSASPRVTHLSAVGAKGLEFDLVVLVGAQAWGAGYTAAVDRYVAMTRATSTLVLAD
ncbi:MAG: RNA polymerase recycling motor ATPase HelR [Nocardioides sp.]|uniref:RNA polymerase recycling motor ATPase HelR n=1 Tax=Nocardioides sp. TaxID=35761 RepID=UPI003F00714D